MGRRARRGAILLVAFSLVSAGCLGGGGPVDEPAEAVDAGDRAEANATTSWSIEGSVTVDHTAGAGLPHTRWAAASVDATCPNGAVSFSLPAGGYTLGMSIDEPSLNGSQPSAGYATLTYRHADGPWKDPEGRTVDEPVDLRQEPPSESTQVTIEDPLPGRWTVQVWPHGPVVNQAWEVHVSADGHGPSADATESPEGPSCG
jgi:hypothetical protein